MSDDSTGAKQDDLHRLGYAVPDVDALFVAAARRCVDGHMRAHHVRVPAERLVLRRQISAPNDGQTQELIRTLAAGARTLAPIFAMLRGGADIVTAGPYIRYWAFCAAGYTQIPCILLGPVPDDLVVLEAPLDGKQLQSLKAQLVDIGPRRDSLGSLIIDS